MKDNFEIPSSVVDARLDSSDALRGDYFQSVFKSPLLNTESSVARPAVSVDAPIPAGISAQGWEQVSQWIANDVPVNFTSAGEGQTPNYFLGADGQLQPNPENPPKPGEPVTVQVEPGPGQDNAKKAAQELQVAAVEYKIALWQQANPGQDVPHFLKSMLASVKSAGPSPEAPQQQTERPPAPQAPPPQMDAAPQAAPRPSYGGGGGGVGGGGGGGHRIGNTDIGAPPRQGYRDGNFEPNGPINRDAIPRPVAGDVQIKGEPTCTVEQVQKFLEDMGSPAAKEEGFAQALYTACTDRGIDPSVAVGFFLQESTCGRYGRAHENRSMGNIKGVAPESGGSNDGFRSYATWAEGARDWARLIDEAYVGKRGMETLSQVISVYAPSSDGNNETKYVQTVKGVVENFKQQNRTTTA